MNMGGGQAKPINADLGGALFADGPAAAFVIAALPLADGYSTTFRNFDLQQQKVKLMQLKVAGSESVTVPAGTFDAYRLDISSADGGSDKMTLWVAKDGRKPIKQSASPGQHGWRRADAGNAVEARLGCSSDGSDRNQSRIASDNALSALSALISASIRGAKTNTPPRISVVAGLAQESGSGPRA